SRGLLRGRDRDPVSVYRIISAEKASFPVSVMCDALQVSRSGYHGWERQAPSDRALSDAWLTEKIKEIHERARGVYGSRRVTAEIRLGDGLEISRKRTWPNCDCRAVLPVRRGPPGTALPGGAACSGSGTAGSMSGGGAV